MIDQSPIGCLRSDPDNRDLIFEHMVNSPCGFIPLPTEFTLDTENLALSVRNQKRRGTCGAFVGACINGFRKKKIMSPEFIYCQRANAPSSGMYGRDVFKILKHSGCISENEFPYAEYDNVAMVNEKQLVAAAENKINGYYLITTIEGLKRALIELGPCYIGLPLYNYSNRFWDASFGSETSGGHAVTVIGYNATGFIILNSWGIEYGDRGISVLPYSDFNCIWEIWAGI